jgi:hypothetical protein
MKKNLCSVPGGCIAIDLDTLGGSAEDWQVSGVWDWWVPADASQLLYALHALRKGHLPPLVRNGSMAVLPMGEVSVGDVASFCARSNDESLAMTRQSDPE